MVDIYTKFILTIIAVALTILVGRSLFEVPQLRAATAPTVGCGNVENPCWVHARLVVGSFSTGYAVDASRPLPVIIANQAR